MIRPKRIVMNLEFLEDGKARIRYKEYFEEVEGINRDKVLELTQKTLEEILSPYEVDIRIERGDGWIEFEFVEDALIVGIAVIGELCGILPQNDEEALVLFQTVGDILRMVKDEGYVKKDIREGIEELDRIIKLPMGNERSVSEIMNEPGSLFRFGTFAGFVIKTSMKIGVISPDDTLKQAARKLKEWLAS